MNYSLTRVSSNRKTGPIPVSTTSAATCPTSCPLRDNGCYMDGGPGAIHWRAITKGDRGVAFDKFCEQVAALPKGQLWRHNQAGDLPGDGNDMDHAKVSQLVAANRGRRGFTYTHKPMDTNANRKAVSEANQQGFTINLSANSLAHADALADLNVGPVASVVSIKWQRQHDKKGAWTEAMGDYRARIKGMATPAGRKVTVCPATYQDDMSCDRCQLCAKSNRRAVVVFPAHGMRKAKASAIAE